MAGNSKKWLRYPGAKDWIPDQLETNRREACDNEEEIVFHDLPPPQTATDPLELITIEMRNNSKGGSSIIDACIEYCMENTEPIVQCSSVPRLIDHSTEIVDLTDSQEEQTTVTNPLLKSTFGKNACPISKLLATRTTMTNAKRMDFIRNGRTLPVINNIVNGGPLDLKNLSNVRWLTGSDSLGQILCWPCILFNKTGPSVWAKNGFSSMNMLMVAVRRHEMDHDHMEAIMQLNLAEIELEQELILVETSQQDDACPEAMELHRSILRQLIDLICIPKIGHCIDFFDSRKSQEHLLEFFNSINGPIKTYQLAHYKNRENIASFLVKSSPEILQSVAHCARSQLKDEIRCSPYIALIIEDVAAFVNDSSYLSFIVRFVDSNCQPCEHFIRYVKVGQERTATNLLKHVHSILTEFDCVQSLVGFTYDGAALAPDETHSFNCGVKLITPKAIFFHYRDHNIQRTLTQAFSHSKCCQGFFYGLDQLHNFFHRIPTMKSMFTEMRQKTTQKILPALNFTSGMVLTVDENYELMVQWCQQVASRPQDWNNDVSERARRCVIFLNNVCNRFTTSLVAAIFLKIKGFVKAATTSDVIAWKREADQAVILLDQLTQDGNFKLPLGEEKSVCSLIRRELVNTAKLFIVERAKDFASLVMYGNIMAFCSQERFTTAVQNDPLFRNSLASSGFDSQPLLAQIDFAYSNNRYLGTEIDQILGVLHQFNLDEDFPELMLFLKLILTVPIISPKAAISPRTYMTSWVDSIRRTKDFTRDDSFLFIEKTYISKLRESEKFYDVVIEFFASLVNRKELFYETKK